MNDVTATEPLASGAAAQPAAAEHAVAPTHRDREVVDVRRHGAPVRDFPRIGVGKH